MGALDRLLRRKKADAEPPPEPDQECIHGSLVPHWDSADDIGKEDRVVSYLCESCHATFSREEGRRLMAEAVERLKTDGPVESG